MNEQDSALPSSANEREELLRKLALRLAIYPSDPSVSNPQLLVGQLPENLPVALPIPPNSRVLGSLIRGPQSLQVLLDVPLSEEEIRNFYQTELTAAGWEVPEMPRGFHEGGFVHSMPIYITFWRGTRGPELRVQVFRGELSYTDVRLHLDAVKRSPAWHMRARHHDIYAVLPLLYPPSGAQQHGGGGGGNNEDVHTSATVELREAMNTADLVVHYTKQLEQAGWTLTGSETSQQSAWSAWSFRDKDNEPWQAAFFVMKLPGQRRRYEVYLHAIWDGAQSQSSPGWFASSSE
jgi:hypothetical protein